MDSGNTKVSEISSEIDISHVYTEGPEWENGKILEKFIGVLEGPLTFKTNGKVVTMMFRHFVSKIIITGVKIGGVQRNATVTFYGISNTIVFHPVPSVNGVPVMPYVEPLKEENTEEETLYDPQISFKFKAEGRNPSSVCYICPEMDRCVIFILKLRNIQFI